MYLGGASGTGKSRVIDAVHAFSASWHREDAVEKTALTGKAATLIGGRTLASFMMRLQHAIQNKHFAPLDLLIIVEVSMMSKSEWLKLDKTLRQYKQLPTVPFGGVHMVLVGDFLQMPPVKADPIYVAPPIRRNQLRSTWRASNSGGRSTLSSCSTNRCAFEATRSGEPAVVSLGSGSGHPSSLTSSIAGSSNRIRSSSKWPCERKSGPTRSS
jgi:hypothetical protein